LYHPFGSSLKFNSLITGHLNQFMAFIRLFSHICRFKSPTLVD